MTKAAPDPLLLSVAAFGGAISLVCLGLGGTFSGFSSAVGSVLALVNLVVLRSIVLRVVSGDIHTKLPLVALIFFKMGAFMLLVFWLITRHWVAPVPLTLGLSSLAIGLIVGSVFSRARSARSQGSES